MALRHNRGPGSRRGLSGHRRRLRCRGSSRGARKRRSGRVLRARGRGAHRRRPGSNGRGATTRRSASAATSLARRRGGHGRWWSGSSRGSRSNPCYLGSHFCTRPCTRLTSALPSGPFRSLSRRRFRLRRNWCWLGKSRLRNGSRCRLEGRINGVRLNSRPPDLVGGLRLLGNRADVSSGRPGANPLYSRGRRAHCYTKGHCGHRRCCRLWWMNHSPRRRSLRARLRHGHHPRPRRRGMTRRWQRGSRGRRGHRWLSWRNRCRFGHSQCLRRTGSRSPRHRRARAGADPCRG